MEDNPYVSNLLQNSLAPHFRLQFASDGITGLEKATQIVPDLILTDMMMPGMDANEMTRIYTLKKPERFATALVKAL